MKNFEPSQSKYKQYLSEARRLGLENDRRIKNLLRLFELNLAKPDDQKDMRRIFSRRDRELFEAGLVVPPPSAQDAMSGPIIVGHTIDPQGENPVGISHSPPCPGVKFGSPGTGKTGLNLAEIESIRNEIPVIVIDPRDDYSCLARRHPADTLVVDADELPLNIFQPDPGVPFKTNARKMVAVLADYLTLYHRGQNVLEKGLGKLSEKGFVPTVRRVLRYLQINSGQFKHNRQAYDSVVERLEGLDSIFGEAWNVEKGFTIPDLCRYRTVVIRTHGLERTDIRVTLTALLMTRCFLWLRAQGDRANQPKIAFVVEEAEYVLSKKLEAESYSVATISEIIHQARAVGLLLNFITQDPTTINKTILNDSGNLFLFSLREGNAQLEMVRSLGLPDEALEQIASLQNRHCYCRLNAGTYRRPFLMRTIDSDIDDTPLSPEELDAQFRRHAVFLDSIAKADEISDEVLGDKPISTQALTKKADVPAVEKKSDSEDLPFKFRGFLMAVENFGHMGVMAVYGPASVSPTTGAKYLQQGIDTGLAGSHEVLLPGRKGKLKTAFLTKAGRDLIGAPTPKGLGGDDHTAFQKEFAFALSEMGYKVAVEDNVNGKSIDLVHRIEHPDTPQFLIALEIEISTNGVENAAKDLEAGCDEVWLICDLASTAKISVLVQEQFGRDDRIHIVSTRDFVREYVKKRKES